MRLTALQLQRGAPSPSAAERRRRRAREGLPGGPPQGDAADGARPRHAALRARPAGRSSSSSSASSTPTSSHVPTVVFDQSRSPESRELVRRLRQHQPLRRSSRYASARATSCASEIVAGHASVGIEIPPDFARRRLDGEPADVLVLIDGSDSAIASQTLAAANGVALSRSLAELLRDAGSPRAAGSRPAPAAALQPRLAQRQPAHPGPDRHPAHLLGHPARRPSPSCASASAARSSS